MRHMLSGTLSLLLDLVLISGQLAEGTLVISEDVVRNVSHVSGVNGTILTETMHGDVVHEDQEDFQDQEKKHHYNNCNETLLMYCVELECLDFFHKYMEYLGQQSWCNWEMVISYYNYLSDCSEICAARAHCYYPNAVAQELFVDVHKQYFNLCGTKEDVLPDAPARVVLVLTLLPVSVIPILVYMVIWKSSVID
ncbi:receptor activity-modifying protein 1-like isoform X2 [Neoarius graeffei]|uniref:receptor activity-modifying protein 1-like isoform X2 n=1 Tax=Neoarius graeffei TaxID=443677 RepID=UPI00298CE46A|nr:receptor activity-modifying protein 1-like isoform X2 [Neoarius graeffei]